MKNMVMLHGSLHLVTVYSEQDAAQALRGGGVDVTEKFKIGKDGVLSYPHPTDKRKRLTVDFGDAESVAAAVEYASA